MLKPMLKGLVHRLIHLQFSEVRSLSTDALDDWLQSPSADQRPLLLDTRSQDEYAVSHIPGAYHLDVDAVAQNPAHRSLDPNGPTLEQMRHHPIVTYCSVGYRSAQAAHHLQQQGFDQVWNLEGSLFKWANEGRSLTTSSPADEAEHSMVKAVHPYNAIWGLLLDPQHHCRQALCRQDG